MSQLTSQPQDANWVSIPFAKFSHNTSPYGTRNITWSHVNYRTNLDLVIRNTRVIDDYGSHSTKIIMKITAGAEVLETQDLSELVRFCNEFNPTSGAEHPVEVVVKSPFLAMRYPKSVNTVRRIQIKFRSEADFEKTLSIIRDIGLSISDKNVPPSAAALSSSSPALSVFSTTSPMSFASAVTSVTRPSSTIETSTKSVSGSFVSPNSPPKSEFKIPTRPESARSEVRKSGLEVSSLTSQFPRPYSSSSIIPSLAPAAPLPRLNSFQEITRQTPSLYLSQLERESQSRRLSHPTQPSQEFPPTNVYQNSSFLSQLQSQNGVQPAQDTSRLLSASPFFSSPLITETPGYSTFGSLLIDDPFTATADSQRPASTPAEHSYIHNMWIPPKRELPFPKPKDNNTAESAVTELPPLPKPKILPKPIIPARTNSAEKAAPTSGVQDSIPVARPAPKKRVAQRKAPVVKSTESNENKQTHEAAPMDLATQDVGGQGELSPLAAKSAASRPSSATAGLVSKAAPVKKRASAPVRPASSNKRPKMVDQGTQTQTLSGRDHTAALKAAPIALPDLTAELTPNPESYLDTLEAFVTKHRARPAPKEYWERPGYAEADDEHRQMMLNDFICENLENAEFLKLCEDAGNAWRRIGLRL